MAGSKVAITISAVDKASARLEAINKKLAGMTAPVRRLGQSFKRFSDASGITKMAKGFGGLARGALQSFMNIARVVGPLNTIIGAASIAGLVRLTTAWADWGSQLGFTAQRLGISASALQTFQGSARLAGSSAGALDSGLQTLGQNMWNAVGGRAPQVVAAFRYLHLSFQNVNGSARSVSQMLPEIADKIKAIRNPFAQAAVATALFGGAGEDLLPFLRQGSAGIAKYNALMQQYGVTNQDGIDAANNMRIAQTGLTLAVQGLGNSVAYRLAPVLDPLLNQMATWISLNRGWISTRIGYYVQQFATWLQSVNWKAIGSGIMSVASGVNSVVQYLGGWGAAARDLAILWGGKWLLGMMAPLVTITAALTRIIGLQRIAALGVWGLPLATSGDAANNPPAQQAQAQQLATEGPAYWRRQLAAHPVVAPTGNALDVMRQGMAYFMSQGWSKTHAAAIMGNAGRESGYNPDAINPTSGAYGIFQDLGARKRALIAEYGPHPTAAQQFQFAQHELMTTESGAAKALHATKDIFSGTVSLDKNFERSDDGFYGNAARIGFANDAYNDQPTVKIDVTHKNAPPGTSVSVKSNSPKATVSSVKVVKSMPGGSV